ncbi:cupredoxin domain-containing protein [Halomonas denitrificans]|uniref:cupredoxin domain-containing protein n=1 Tax=Halomonas TaxID=2745 RepID=UPI001CD1E254|nr:MULTISPECIES: cupredoxin domain-containing protein [Halomonas]MCA0917209.1 cupredoxin domain-containing protein [Halomonas denitrificans]MCA0976216.1 cupredoxin domain-containing protein [Halomonas denitrificans]
MLLLRRSPLGEALVRGPLVALSLMSLWAVAGEGLAEGLPSYRLTLDDGRLEPTPLLVRAGERFKLELHNSGATPVEFESRRLRQEKVMGPGVHSFVVIHPLKPGRYEYFDEFHLPEAQGEIIAVAPDEQAAP